MRRTPLPWLLVASSALLVWAAPKPACAQSAGPALGLFEGHTDVGTVLHPGSVGYDPSTYAYQIAGSGDNMWASADAFQFVWRKVSGDVTLTADISILGTGGEAHRKAVLMIRQSLDADSAYADAALHGVGLTSIQARLEKGGNSSEVQSSVSAPKRLRIAKRGDYFYIWVAAEGEELHFSGGSMRIRMTEPFYVGLGVCAHNKDNVEKAVFTKVDLVVSAPNPAARTALYSTLETFPVPGDRHVTYVAPGRIEAPAWTRDGASLLFSRNGRIEQVKMTGGEPQPVPTGSATHSDRFHGLSPDGKQLAITGGSQPNRAAIYVVPLDGGAPRRVTRQSPSYWHGWSPDGKTLVFTGVRKGKTDIYTIPAEGGEETRLATAQGANDNPEFSPDGKYIYFNSDRAGSMQVWRMLADGSGQEQVTSDEFSNWSPHLSPDGRRMVVLSCDKSATKLPTDQDVMLRVLLLADKRVQTVARLVGGEGSMDAPSWSPDGRRLAFVSYQLIPRASPPPR